MGIDSEDNVSEKKAKEFTGSEEVAFLKASLNSRPVGVKKHWEMAALVQNMHEILGKSIDPDKCWHHLESMYALDVLDEREELPFSNDKEDFALPSGWDLAKGSEKEADSQEEKLATPKIVKDYSRVKDKKSQVNKKNDQDSVKSEKADSTNESDEEDSPLLPAKVGRKSRLHEVKKSTPTSTKKETPKRGARSVKESNEKRESSPAVSKKAEDEPKGSSKKESGQVGKRSLRSRGDDDGSSSPAPTPPPSKRARRL